MVRTDSTTVTCQVIVKKAEARQLSRDSTGSGQHPFSRSSLHAHLKYSLRLIFAPAPTAKVLPAATPIISWSKSTRPTEAVSLEPTPASSSPPHPKLRCTHVSRRVRGCDSSPSTTSSLQQGAAGVHVCLVPPGPRSPRSSRRRFRVNCTAAAAGTSHLRFSWQQLESRRRPSPSSPSPIPLVR